MTIDEARQVKIYSVLSLFARWRKWCHTSGNMLVSQDGRKSCLRPSYAQRCAFHATSDTLRRIGCRPALGLGGLGRRRA
jgi:hypothetical protein